MRPLTRSGLVVWSAGASPKITPVSSVTAKAKPNSRPPKGTATLIGNSVVVRVDEHVGVDGEIGEELIVIGY